MTIEKDCPICGGTGVERCMRPVSLGAKLASVPCKACGGYRTKAKTSAVRFKKCGM